MNTPPTGPSTPLARRHFLVAGGAAAIGAAAFAASRGVGSAAATAPTSSLPVDGSVAGALSTGTPAETVFTAADFAGLGVCKVLPELTAGPYPTIEQIERRTITEGLPGLPLRVGIQVVDEACVPIPGAVVEIWHCDVDGDYSAYADGATADDAGEGTTFLRGFQVANADGIAEFLTNYPGWYAGRAVHIHARVHLDDTTVLTTQFLFDDELNTQVFTGAYAAQGVGTTTNETDGVARGADVADLLFTVYDDEAVSGLRALIVVGVDA